MFRFNTARATGLIGIVVWSWRTASTREVRGFRKRPANVGHIGFSMVVRCCINVLKTRKTAQNCELFQPLSKLLFESSGFKISSHAAFETDAEQLLRFNGEFHREFLEHFFAEAVHDHVHCILRGEAALVAIKDLVFADL